MTLHFWVLLSELCRSYFFNWKQRFWHVLPHSKCCSHKTTYFAFLALAILGNSPVAVMWFNNAHYCVSRNPQPRRLHPIRLAQQIKVAKGIEIKHIHGQIKIDRVLRLRLRRLFQYLIKNPTDDFSHLTADLVVCSIRTDPVQEADEEAEVLDCFGSGKA
jgi:hypothetical protein